MSEPMTQAELARALGITRQAMWSLMRRPDFPAPVADRRWDPDEVLAWRRARTPEARLLAALADGPIRLRHAQHHHRGGLRRLLAAGRVRIVPRPDRANGSLVELVR